MERYLLLAKSRLLGVLSHSLELNVNKSDGPLIEEQTLPFYDEKRYYPVRIGDTLKNRYRTIAKLGYGSYSTVWLARDERTKEYATLKVCIEQNDDKPSPVLNESPWLMFYPPCYLRTLQTAFPNVMVPKLLVRPLVHRLFFAINWLTATCNLILTDLDDSCLKDIEGQEAQDPSIPIISDSGVPVYPSREPFLELGGIPMLTDFGQLRDDDGRINQDWIMPDLYRAPEALLQIPWTFQVDMWSVGVMGSEGKNVFDPIDHVNNQYVLPLALAQYIGYLGLPPLYLIQNSPLFSTYFDEKGSNSKISFENFVTTIPPGKEKVLFLKFIRKMLAWDPEARATANEIIEDEWLQRPFDKMI
ncbi:kinase-like domain-containing protein [Aspergillus transmontanensis]|uniref:Kinase-like domain-containing protein n=1 Tax=Aspergillus transmontanensis TaxID=1034304 RepID=A0A5N6WGY9_9EURO|nr:kinase-like domain-containing protein [Aspergillus transmontanensis]